MTSLAGVELRPSAESLADKEKCSFYLCSTIVVHAALYIYKKKNLIKKPKQTLPPLRNLQSQLHF